MATPRGIQHTQLVSAAGNAARLQVEGARQLAGGIASIGAAIGDALVRRREMAQRQEEINARLEDRQAARDLRVSENAKDRNLRISENAKDRALRASTHVSSLTTKRDALVAEMEGLEDPRDRAPYLQQIGELNARIQNTTEQATLQVAQQRARECKDGQCGIPTAKPGGFTFADSQYRIDGERKPKPAAEVFEATPIPPNLADPREAPGAVAGGVSDAAGAVDDAVITLQDIQARHSQARVSAGQKFARAKDLRSRASSLPKGARHQRRTLRDAATKIEQEAIRDEVYAEDLGTQIESIQDAREADAERADSAGTVASAMAYARSLGATGEQLQQIQQVLPTGISDPEARLRIEEILGVDEKKVRAAAGRKRAAATLKASREQRSERRAAEGEITEERIGTLLEALNSPVETGKDADGKTDPSKTVDPAQDALDNAKTADDLDDLQAARKLMPPSETRDKVDAKIEELLAVERKIVEFVAAFGDEPTDQEMETIRRSAREEAGGAESR